MRFDSQIQLSFFIKEWKGSHWTWIGGWSSIFYRILSHHSLLKFDLRGFQSIPLYTNLIKGAACNYIGLKLKVHPRQRLHCSIQNSTHWKTQSRFSEKSTFWGESCGNGYFCPSNFQLELGHWRIYFCIGSERVNEWRQNQNGVLSCHSVFAIAASEKQI